uniref:Pentatricopeptide repeat-containing protein n=1 Tax=Kalanchoe fedtschenkoi TaxID=63787 RepID=A0A7N0VFH5_KALFE
MLAGRCNRCRYELGLRLVPLRLGFRRKSSAELVGRCGENGAKSSKLVALRNSQITRHGRNGNVREAERVFRSMGFRNVVSWTAMLTAYAENGRLKEAVEIFDEMPERSVASCNAMITAYVRNGAGVSVGEAFALFCEMNERNAVTYGAMIMGFVMGGMICEAEKLYLEMPEQLRDPVASNVLMSGYLKAGKLEEAVGVFEGMRKRNVVSWSSMVDGYCKVGMIREARDVFDRMPERNVVSWTAMIDGYMKSGYITDGFELFSRMRSEGELEINSTTLSTMFEACGNFGKYREGIQLHKLALCSGFESDGFLGTSIVNMYFRYGHSVEALKVFYTMGMKDVISWNALLAGHVQNNEIEEAYRLFEKLPCKDAVSWTTMIIGFFKKGEVGESMKLFEMMPSKDHVAWTAVLSGLVDNGKYQEAVQWFIEMLRNCIAPNPLTLCTVVGASTGLATLNEGLQVHAYVVKSNLALDLSIANALISMYSKRGSVKDANRVFRDVEVPNIVSFNSMVTGFAQNGFGAEALELLDVIRHAGLVPNNVTFLTLLSACVHMGLVDDGWNIFNSMRYVYKIEPRPDHYACMVDLLGRAGLLDEALDILKSMPCKPHAGVWGALLGASQIHSRLDLAKLASEELFSLDPNNAAPYVVLSNLYSSVGEWEKDEKTISDKKMRLLKKIPGSSQIFVNNTAS